MTENALPAMTYPSPPHTRSRARTHVDCASDSASDDSVSSGEGGGVQYPRLGATPVAPSTPPGEAGDDSSDEKGTTTSDDEGENEWEVTGIDTYRRVGKKRGRLEYLAQWKDGSETWEPAGSFKLDMPDVVTGAKYLPVFEEFRERMNSGEVDEYRGETVDGGVASIERGESESNSLSSTSSTSENSSSSDSIDRPSSEVEEEIKTALENRIRVLKLIVKGGVEVPKTRKQAMKSACWPKYFEAENVELSAFDEFDVWELVPRPRGANVIGTRWVYDVKMDSDGNVVRYKARLVAQGFKQIKGIDYNDIFSPTMHIKTARALLAVAARDNVIAYQYDISTAFLHAGLNETIFVSQPPGHVEKGNDDYVYKLKKAMYGLKNAPKAYSDFFMGVLNEMGFTQSKQDECLWMLKKNGSYVYCLFHVDDILCVSNDVPLRDSCFKQLEKQVKIRDEGQVNMFLGLKITRHDDGSYTMSQKHYIEQVAARFNIDTNTKPTETPCVYGNLLSPAMLPKNDDEKRAAVKLPYQALLGCLIYTAKTRPDVAYAISDAARFMSNWGVGHYKAALRILRYLYTTRDVCIHIKPVGELKLYAYTDANWCDPRETGGEVDDKYKPQFGYLVGVGGVLLSWTSRRQQSRAKSSMEAEFYAASEASKEVLFWRALLEELDIPQHNPTIIYEDNSACISYSKNNTCHQRTKHIDLRAYDLRDHVRNNTIKLVHVDTKQQLADIMTKAQLKNTFMTNRDNIFNSNHIPQVSKTKRVAAKDCHCLTCFVSCESDDKCMKNIKSVHYDPILLFDAHW